MASVSNEDADVGFQIAPMVDVVFVLMLFFMASAGMQVATRELSINLPTTQQQTTSIPSKELPSPPILVKIHSDGSVSVEGASYGVGDDKDLYMLREYLKASLDFNEDGNKSPVVICPEMTTTHARIMDVLNAAAASGVTNLTFQ